jgi:hypothetical protein
MGPVGYLSVDGNGKRMVRTEIEHKYSRVAEMDHDPKLLRIHLLVSCGEIMGTRRGESNNRTLLQMLGAHIEPFCVRKQIS